MKKPKFTLLLLLFTASSLTFSQNMGIGTKTPEVSALLDLDPPNKDKGLLLPRLTTVERDGISTPAESLLIFNTDSQCYEGYSEAIDQWFPVGCLQSKPLCESEFTDNRDGITYKIVEIGSQCWMAENLAYLPVVHSNIEFQIQGMAGKPGYGVYNYDGSDVATAKAKDDYKTYGVYYNGYAVVDTDNPACPTGWHVPSDAEWKKMEIYLGMDPTNADATIWRNTGNVGTKLKTDTWGGNNSSGFTALPAGIRNNAGGSFDPVGIVGIWWSASKEGEYAFRRALVSTETGVSRHANTDAFGFSIRCLLD